MAEKPDENRDQPAIEDTGAEVTQSTTENVMIAHHHHHYNDHRTVVQGNIYHGGEFKGDIMTAKTEVKDATIGAIGGPMPDPRDHKRHSLAIGAPESQLALPWPDPGQQLEDPIQGMVDRPALSWPERSNVGSSASPPEPVYPRRRPLAIGGAESRPALPWPGFERHPGTSQTTRRQYLPCPEEPCGHDEEVEHQRGAESLSPGHHEVDHQTTPKDTGSSSAVGQQRRQGSGARPKQRTAATQGTRPKDPSKYSTEPRDHEEEVEHQRGAESLSPSHHEGGNETMPKYTGPNAMEERDVENRENVIHCAFDDSDVQSKEVHDVQNSTEVKITYNTESQTTRKITRERMIQTETEPKFDSESQTDNPLMRERMSQTELRSTEDSVTQTIDYSETKEKIRIQAPTENSTQTEPKIVSESDTQTNVTELLNTQSQTVAKTFDENGFQTDEKEMATSSIQTDITATSNVESQTAHNESDLLPGVISAFKILTADKAKKDPRLKFINLFNKQNLDIQDEFKERFIVDLPQLICTVWSTILTRLMTEICENFQNRWNQTENALADLCLLNMQQISKQNLEWQKISQFTPLAKVVLEMGKEFASDKKYIHALISYYTAAKLYKLSNSGDYSVLGIKTCLRQTTLLVEEIADQDPLTGIIIGQAIEFMREMKDFILSIQHSTHASRIMSEAKCLFGIGLCFGACQEFQQSAIENESAIELLETEFKENAKEYYIYGDCFNNAGVAYLRMGNITKAIVLYKRALDAYESAKDWESEEEKQAKTRTTYENFRRAYMADILADI